ncbi:YigZ family protein [bacterium]|nr:YigZ family protein [bacterium]
MTRDAGSLPALDLRAVDWYHLMMDDERYTTLAAPAGAEVVEQRSRFIGHAARAETRDAASAFIDDVKQRHPRATHHCWAYRVGYPDRPEEYFSDAGEPSGTAGRPMLNVLCQAGMQNVVVAVARYFGGTKLGVRGLIDAYRLCAATTISAGTAVIRQPMTTMALTVSYDRFDTLRRLVEQTGGQVTQAEYSAQVRMIVEIPRSASVAFAETAHAIGVESSSACE